MEDSGAIPRPLTVEHETPEYLTTRPGPELREIFQPGVVRRATFGEPWSLIAAPDRRAVVYCSKVDQREC